MKVAENVKGTRMLYMSTLNLEESTSQKTQTQKIQQSRHIIQVMIRGRDDRNNKKQMYLDNYFPYSLKFFVGI